jgi:hypothetical protein
MIRIAATKTPDEVMSGWDSIQAVFWISDPQIFIHDEP